MRMKTFKKILASLMVAVMVLTAAPLGGFVGLKLNLDWLDFNTKASAVAHSGTCGENLTYSFDGEVLTISGSGEMCESFYPDYSSFDNDKEGISLQRSMFVKSSNRFSESMSATLLVPPVGLK